MELWIRNQDKTRLTMVNDLYLVHDENNACDYIGSNMVGHLAKYTTPGRALEILDEIDERIMLLNTFSIAKDRDTLLALKNALPEEKLQGLAYPYEMPKE